MAKVALADFSADESKEPEQTTPIRGFDDLDDPKDVEGAAPLLAGDGNLAERVRALEDGNLQERVRALEETPDTATLHALARREPNSFHQATIYYGLVSETASTTTKLSLLAVSFGIVLLQCAVAAGLWLGTAWTSCSDHTDCPGGSWCAPHGTCDDCEPGLCESDSNATESWALGSADSIVNGTTIWKIHGKTHDGMCEACTNAEGEFVTEYQAIDERVASMRISDWTALLLASFVIAFGVFGEVRDAMLCEFSMAAIRQKKEVPRVWREAIGLLNLFRLFGFLPFIVMSVVQLVLYRGASALAICLNTVAVLFLVELDNLAFSHGLNEETRMEAEEFGRVSVTDEDSRLIDVIKRVCVLMIPAIIVGGVRGKTMGIFLIDILLFTVVVVVQSVWRAPPAGKFAAICWGLLRALKGLVVIPFLFVMAWI